MGGFCKVKNLRQVVFNNNILLILETSLKYPLMLKERQILVSAGHYRHAVTNTPDHKGGLYDVAQ